MQSYFYFLHHYKIYLVVLRAVINYLTSKWQMRACEVGHANSWANKLRRWWMVGSGVRSSCGCLSQLQTRPKLTSIILTVVQQYRGCSHPDGIDIQRIKQCILYMVIYSDGLVQDCSALAMELLQSYTKPLQESIPRLFNGGEDHYDHPLCPGLHPGPPSQTPGSLGQRYWSEWGHLSHVTAEIFRALQPNAIDWTCHWYLDHTYRLTFWPGELQIILVQFRQRWNNFQIFAITALYIEPLCYPLKLSVRFWSYQ